MHFVHARTFQNLCKNLSDFILDDGFGILGIEFRVSVHEFFRPIRVLGKLVVCAKVFAVQKRCPQVGHLLFESARQNRQTHALNQTDVFLLNMVQFLMRMV